MPAGSALAGPHSRSKPSATVRSHTGFSSSSTGCCLRTSWVWRQKSAVSNASRASSSTSPIDLPQLAARAAARARVASDTRTVVATQETYGPARAIACAFLAAAPPPALPSTTCVENAARSPAIPVLARARASTPRPRQRGPGRPRSGRCGPQCHNLLHDPPAPRARLQQTAPPAQGESDLPNGLPTRAQLRSRTEASADKGRLSDRWRSSGRHKGGVGPDVLVVRGEQETRPGR